MRIIFMGSPEFALPTLKKLNDSRHEIAAVVTSPDKPKGRGLSVSSTPVKVFANKKKIKTLQPVDLKSPEFIRELKAAEADLYIIVAFRILPEEVLNVPSRGIINLHPSMLPKYRGAAPINWAIINGETETGLTTFLIEKKVDAGQILLQKPVKIGPEETAGELSERLAESGAELIIETIDKYEKKEIIPKIQSEEGITRAPKIKKEDCLIRWNGSNKEVYNFIRGLSPVPCAYSSYKDQNIKIFKAEIFKEKIENPDPGRIYEVDEKQGLIIETSSGGIIVKDLMREGKKRMPVENFLRGSKITAGEYFGK